MGSAARHSSGRSAASVHARKRKREGVRPALSRSAPPSVVAMLGTISDSISMVATATKALAGAQAEDGKLIVSDAGDELVTLEHALNCLRHGFEALELAFRDAADFALRQEDLLPKRR